MRTRLSLHPGQGPSALQTLLSCRCGPYSQRLTRQGSRAAAGPWRVGALGWVCPNGPAVARWFWALVGAHPGRVLGILSQTPQPPGRHRSEARGSLFFDGEVLTGCGPCLFQPPTIQGKHHRGPIPRLLLQGSPAPGTVRQVWWALRKARRAHTLTRGAPGHKFPAAYPEPCCAFMEAQGCQQPGFLECPCMPSAGLSAGIWAPNPSHPRAAASQAPPQFPAAAGSASPNGALLPASPSSASAEPPPLPVVPRFSLWVWLMDRPQGSPAASVTPRLLVGFFQRPPRAAPCCPFQASGRGTWGVQG